MRLPARVHSRTWQMLPKISWIEYQRLVLHTQSQVFTSNRQVKLVLFRPCGPSPSLARSRTPPMTGPTTVGCPSRYHHPDYFLLHCSLGLCWECLLGTYFGVGIRSWGPVKFEVGAWTSRNSGSTAPPKAWLTFASTSNLII